MSLAISGKGVKFRRWNASLSVPVWEDIAEINSIDGPSMSRETIDVTSMDSTEGYREFIASFRDAGSLTLSMNFRRDTYDIMKGDFESDALQNYEMLFPDTQETSFEFTGLVTELPLSVPSDDKITVDVTIKISGKMTVNSGSGS